MAHFFTTYNSTTGNGNVFVRQISDTVPTNLLIQQALNIRPVMVKYKNRTYNIGQFSRGLVYNENAQLTPIGVLPPSTVPTMTTGTFSGGDEGEQIGFLTFAHKIGLKVMQESNPSAPSLTLDNPLGAGRLWGNIPPTATDARVTHVRGYVSLDGDIPSLAWERPIGVTTVLENSLDATRAITLPVNQGLDGAQDLDTNARGVPPYCQFAEMYHQSMYYAGDPLHPERIYRSRLFEPESVNSVESSDDSPSGYFETLDGEAVTGLKQWNDLLIVTCLRCVYAIQGFSGADIQILKLTRFYGCVSNASLQLVGPRGDLWGAGQEGVWMYDGSFHDFMYDALRDYWSNNYLANATTFQQTCFAAEDRKTRVYKIQTPKPSDAPAGVNSFKWIGHWEPTIKGLDPWWTFDMRARSDSIMGVLLAQDNSTYLDAYTGSCDGIIRKENVDTDAADDSDTFAKRFDAIGKHFFMGDQGGDDDHGFRYTDLDAFLQNETVPVTVSLYAGDDTATDAYAPQWTQVIPAGAVTLPRAKVARTSLEIQPTHVSGKGASVRFTATSPLGVKLRGYNLYFETGKQDRPYTE